MTDELLGQTAFGNRVAMALGNSGALMITEIGKRGATRHITIDEKTVRALRDWLNAALPK